GAPGAAARRVRRGIARRAPYAAALRPHDGRTRDRRRSRSPDQPRTDDDEPARERAQPRRARRAAGRRRRPAAHDRQRLRAHPRPARRARVQAHGDGAAGARPARARGARTFHRGIARTRRGGGMSGPTVEVHELVKRYPKAPVNAIDGISFSVPAGEVFGLLGPNGAGKTTTVAMLTTRARPTAGEAQVAGVDVFHDPVSARSRFAVVPQRSNLDRALSIRDNLVFHAAYHGVSAGDRRRRAGELLDEFRRLD